MKAASILKQTGTLMLPALQREPRVTGCHTLSSASPCSSRPSICNPHLPTTYTQANNTKYQRVFNGAPNPTAKSLWTSQVSITGARCFTETLTALPKP